MEAYGLCNSQRTNTGLEQMPASCLLSTFFKMLLK